MSKFRDYGGFLLSPGLGTFTASKRMNRKRKNSKTSWRNIKREMVDLFENKPQEIKFEKMGPTELSKIQEDPRFKDAQLKALSGLSELADTGLGAPDLEAIDQIKKETAQQERGQREAIMQSARQRGMSGSGAALGQMLSQQQGSAERASQAGLRQAAQAQQARQQAIGQLGGLGTQVRGQEYGMAAQRATAQDAINKFNIAQRQMVTQQNIANRFAQQQGRLAALSATEKGKRARGQMGLQAGGAVLQTAGNIIGSLYGGGGGG